MSSVLRSGTLWAGVVVAAVGAVAVAGATSIPPSGALSDPLGPRAFPLGLGVAAIVLGAVLAVRARLTRHAGGAETGRLRTVGVLVGAVLLYVVLLVPAGFPLTTFAFFGGLFWYLGERRLWLCAVVSAAVTAVLYAGFAYGLGVALPIGFGW